jgi:hypothetical protein
MPVDLVEDVADVHEVALACGTSKCKRSEGSCWVWLEHNPNADF